MCSSFNDVGNKSTSSANRKFVRQLHMLLLRRLPLLSSCHLVKSSFSAYCNTVLKSNLLSGSPCLVPLRISNASLSLTVKTLAFWSTYSLCKSSMYLCSMSQCSNDFHKYSCLILPDFGEVNRRYAQWDAPLLTALLGDLQFDEIF